MPPKVIYNFSAAEDLSRALHQLQEKIKWLIWMRDSNRARYLDCGAGGWTGSKHEDFVNKLNAQQKLLHALADEAGNLKSQVDQATDDAQAAKRRHIHH